MKNKYIPTAAGLYLNYLIHGMGGAVNHPQHGPSSGTVGNRQSRRIDRYIFVRYW